MTDKERELHQLFQGADYYLSLATVITIDSELLDLTVGETIDLDDFLYSDRLPFQKGAHLASAAIRLCTIAEIIGSVDQFKISGQFYDNKQKVRVGGTSRANVLCGIRENVSQYVAFLIRDTITHREEDSKQQYWTDKQYYLHNLTITEIQYGLQTFRDQLYCSQNPNKPVHQLGSAGG